MLCAVLFFNFCLKSCCLWYILCPDYFVAGCFVLWAEIKQKNRSCDTVGFSINKLSVTVNPAYIPPIFQPFLCIFSSVQHFTRLYRHFCLMFLSTLVKNVICFTCLGPSHVCEVYLVEIIFIYRTTDKLAQTKGYWLQSWKEVQGMCLNAQYWLWFWQDDSPLSSRWL